MHSRAGDFAVVDTAMTVGTGTYGARTSTINMSLRLTRPYHEAS